MSNAAVRTLLDDLARPEAYPPPAPSSVSLVTTHISWVFLTDDEAWKLKRPVDYGFLDYTTPEKRRHYCHEEVRLNRRLAPDVYLGVVPVRLNHGHAFHPEGTIVDYAVRMRRLPEAASADALLRRGALTHEQLTRIAAVLARFYARAREAPAFGSPDLARRNAQENFEQVRPFIGRFVGRDVFDEAELRQTAFLSAHERAFRARVDHRRIREGHGDLRLEHVYFEGADPIIIDCIEFNERFRMLDAASDLAFLAMELDARAAPGLSAWLLGQFAAESNDYDLYSVVDFYLAYRAWVRVKVACFLAADPSTPEAKALRKAGEARALVELARGYLAPRTGGAIVAVGGLTGAGKSTLAAALSRATGFPVVASDRTRKDLAGVPATERAPESAYTAPFTRRTFDEVFRRARVVAESGRGVILDATFRSKDVRARAKALAETLGRPFLFVEAGCDEATLRERLKRRCQGRSVSDADERVLARLRGEFEPPEELEAAERAAVDTAQPLEPQVQALAARIQNRP